MKLFMFTVKSFTGSSGSCEYTLCLSGQFLEIGFCVQPDFRIIIMRGSAYIKIFSVRNYRLG